MVLEQWEQLLKIQNLNNIATNLGTFGLFYLGFIGIFLVPLLLKFNKEKCLIVSFVSFGVIEAISIILLCCCSIMYMLII